MRLRIADRILVAIAGLLLLAICAGIVAQMFFSVDLVSLAVRAFSSDAPQVRWGLIGLATVFLLLGGYCVMVLFRHRRRKDKFILQKNDSGELAISVKALEHMVQKCVDQHPEMDIQHLYLENRKDGLLIRLRGSVAGGISIPLTVEALQKQNAGILFAGDEATTDIKVTGYPVQFELVFRDEFMKTEATIPEDAQIVIGRGGEATIQTNPGDTSVSHRHGVFSVRNGQVCYTDQSRNGTRYNGQRTLRKGDTIALPFGAIVYLEVGAHTVKVRANRPA